MNQNFQICSLFILNINLGLSQTESEIKGKYDTGMHGIFYFLKSILLQFLMLYQS